MKLGSLSFESVESCCHHLCPGNLFDGPISVSTMGDMEQDNRWFSLQLSMRSACYIFGA